MNREIILHVVCTSCLVFHHDCRHDHHQCLITILAQCTISSSASYQNDNYRTKVLGHRTGVGVGGDGDGGHHGERADGDEDQEDLEEDHLGAG